jgi:ABC-type antimicrobial peptide transport system permease subunit
MSIGVTRIPCKILFGCAALLLAALGIYGLMAYAVQQRTREIGVRIAIGAASHQVRNMVLWAGFRIAIAGIVIGLAGAFTFTRLLTRLLFGVTAHDPVAFTLAPIVLSGVALMGAWVPALRASRLDPTVALRTE